MLPRSVTELLRLVHPVPPLVRAHSRQIIEVIRMATGGRVTIGSLETHIRNLMEGTQDAPQASEAEKASAPAREAAASSTRPVAASQFVSVPNQLDELLKEGAHQLMSESTASCPKVSLSTAPQQLALSRIPAEPEPTDALNTIQSELNPNQMFHDLAALSVVMEGSSSSSSEEEEEIRVEIKPESDKKEPIMSLRSAYENELGEITELKRPKETPADELVGPKRVDLSSKVRLEGCAHVGKNEARYRVEGEETEGK